MHPPRACQVTRSGGTSDETMQFVEGFFAAMGKASV
jgi:hypothetical protein